MILLFNFLTINNGKSKTTTTRTGFDRSCFTADCRTNRLRNGVIHPIRINNRLQLKFTGGFQLSFFYIRTMKFKTKQERRRYTATHPSLLRPYERRNLYNDRTAYLEELNSLKRFFSTVELPETIQLSKWETITDPDLCISTLITMLEGCPNNYVYRVYFDRLRNIKAKIDES